MLILTRCCYQIKIRAWGLILLLLFKIPFVILEKAFWFLLLILPNSLRKTVFNLFTTDTPISAESSYSVVFRLLTASVFFVSFFFNANVVGTNLNCMDMIMQFKLVPTTYAL